MRQNNEVCQCCDSLCPDVEFREELDECWCETCWEIHTENVMDAMAEQATLQSLKYNI